MKTDNKHPHPRSDGVESHHEWMTDTTKSWWEEKEKKWYRNAGAVRRETKSVFAHQATPRKVSYIYFQTAALKIENLVKGKKDLFLFCSHDIVDRGQKDETN